MYGEIERPRVDPIETKWAIDQLIASGLLEKQGEGVRLSDAGITAAFDIERRLSVSERLLLMLMYYDIEHFDEGLI